MPLPDILELLTALEADHAAGRHLYRGQMRRYEPHRWTVGGSEREVEALYPADYRFHYRHHDFSQGNLGRISARVSSARAHGRQIREAFAAMLLLHLASLGEGAHWAEGLLPEFGQAVRRGTAPADAAFYRAAWSLAQHYLIATALTDVTFDPRIAAWFATQPWEPDDAGPDLARPGVVYRIDGDRLAPILENATALARLMAEKGGEARPPECFLVDIRNIPSDFARRPTSQQGASIYGFDQALVIAAAFKGGAIEAFEFRHREGVDVGVARTDVVPPDDPFLPFVARFNAARAAARPTAIDAPSGADTAPSLLERANAALRLGVASARERERVELTDPAVATVFDQIERHATIPFRYLMIVADEPDGVVRCAITCETLALPVGLQELPPGTLEALGFGGDVLRLWTVGGAGAADMGAFPTIGEFTERALALARRVVAE